MSDEFQMFSLHTNRALWEQNAGADSRESSKGDR